MLAYNNRTYIYMNYLSFCLHIWVYIWWSCYCCRSHAENKPVSVRTLRYHSFHLQTLFSASTIHILYNKYTHMTAKDSICSSRVRVVRHRDHIRTLNRSKYCNWFKLVSIYHIAHNPQHRSYHREHIHRYELLFFLYIPHFQCVLPLYTIHEEYHSHNHSHIPTHNPPSS